MSSLTQQLPALVVGLPFFSAMAVTLLTWRNRDAAFPVALIGLALCAAASLALSIHVATDGPVIYRMGGWEPPMGISFYVDGLNVLVLAIISFVALVNLSGTRPAVRLEYAGKDGSFYTLYLLCVTGHLGMVITSDAFNLFVLVEIAALSGYALLGWGSSRAPLSTLNYLFIGVIGASFYLLGVGFLYIQTGSLNMLDIAGIIKILGVTPTLTAAFGLILSGILIKMAFFPAHGWLPNAYCHAGSPAVSLIAPMTTKVMVYVMVRMMLTVFSPELVFDRGLLPDLMVLMASVAIVICGLMALSAKNLKRMLTYVLITEVGYMVGGAWLGNRAGMTGTVLHVVNDAAMTLTMFMAVGCLSYKLGKLDYKKLQGAFSRMPFTMSAFVLGAIAMIGVPPTCGFFSKWYLILGGLEAGHIEFVVALILSSLINVVLFFKVFEIGFFEPWPEGTDSHGHPHRPAIAMREAPASMVAPLVVSALALVGLGLMNSKLVAIIENALPASLY